MPNINAQLQGQNSQRRAIDKCPSTQAGYIFHAKYAEESYDITYKTKFFSPLSLSGGCIHSTSGVNSSRDHFEHQDACVFILRGFPEKDVNFGLRHYVRSAHCCCVRLLSRCSTETKGNSSRHSNLFAACWWSLFVQGFVLK